MDFIDGRMAIMKRVEVTGWKRGFLAISFLKLLRQSGARPIGLAEAKDFVDRVLVGETVQMDFNGSEEADAFVREAVELGALVSAPIDVRKI
jgi:ribosomal protein L7/L12